MQTLECHGLSEVSAVLAAITRSCDTVKQCDVCLMSYLVCADDEADTVLLTSY